MRSPVGAELQLPADRVEAGDNIRIYTTATAYEYYRVAKVVSNTSLLLSRPYLGSTLSGLSYAAGYAAGPVLRSFVQAVRAGDYTTICIMADYLEDNNDPRGEILRAGMLDLITGLFPECDEQE